MGSTEIMSQITQVRNELSNCERDLTRQETLLVRQQANKNIFTQEKDNLAASIQNVDSQLTRLESYEDVSVTSRVYSEVMREEVRGNKRNNMEWLLEQIVTDMVKDINATRGKIAQLKTLRAQLQNRISSLEVSHSQACSQEAAAAI